MPARRGNPLWLPVGAAPCARPFGAIPCGCPDPPTIKNGVILVVAPFFCGCKRWGSRTNHRGGTITEAGKITMGGHNHQGGQKAPPLRRSRRTARKSLFFHGHHPQCYTRKSSGLFCGCHLTVGGKITIGGQNHGGGKNHQGWTQSPGRAPCPTEWCEKCRLHGRHACLILF